MCGIFGAVSPNGFFHADDYDKFTHLTDLAQHRGPDASGYLALSIKEAASQCRNRFDTFLGHRRLSIIDLSESANQPMRGNGDIWLTFNGEIYNYLELKRSSDLRAYPFRTASDTETILAVYETLGENSFHLFNGEWAFALADLARRRVVLSRDRFSIKPLYLTWQNGALYFASEIKQLLPLIASREPDLDIIQAYLDQGLLDFSDQTFFRHILRLRAKANLVISFDGTSVRTVPYWGYDIRQNRLSESASMEQFREILNDSVRLRLRSDVKVGATVSGGLDSSTLAVLANDAPGFDLQTFSVIPFNPRFSEARFIDKVVSACNINNRTLFLDESQVTNALDEVIRVNDEPPAGFSAVAHFRMMEMIRDESDVTVLLSGQGGDETLLGYRKFYFLLLREALKAGQYWKFIRDVVSSALNRTILWQFDWAEAQRYSSWATTRGSKPYLSSVARAIPLYAYETMSKRQIADIDCYSVPNLTHYEDRNSMAFSLEMRLPFLDHRLVNFALSLDTDLKLHHGWTKYILRKTMHELPREIRWRRDKQGFTLPEEVWLRTEMTQVIRSLFRHSTLEDLGVLNSAKFLTYYNDFVEGKISIWYTDISRVLMAELWARRHFERNAPAIAEVVESARIGRT